MLKILGSTWVEQQQKLADLKNAAQLKKRDKKVLLQLTRWARNPLIRTLAMETLAAHYAKMTPKDKALFIDYLKEIKEHDTVRTVKQAAEGILLQIGRQEDSGTPALMLIPAALTILLIVYALTMLLPATSAWAAGLSELIPG